MTTYAEGISLRLNQTGTYFRFRFLDRDGSVLDVSTATALQMGFKAPDGTISWETATFSTDADHTGDGTDGWVEFNDATPSYTTAEGRWKYFGRVTFSGAGPFGTTTLTYRVKAEGDG